MLFRILDEADDRDREDWLLLWSEWSDREIAAHPAYVSLFARPGDRSLCAAMRTPQGNVMFPFILRPLALEPWYDLEPGLCDIVSPYGYGGPFAWGSPDTERFWSEFDGWAKGARVVSTFVRLSLFEQQLIPFQGTVEVRGPNVVRRLDRPMSAIWREYAHKVRKNVQNAIRNNVKIEIDLDGRSSLTGFLNVYYSTLDRRNAHPFYYFSETFFQTLIATLRGHFAFFNAVHEGRIVSSELVLVSANYIYSFLGGSSLEAFPIRANDLIKHTITEWGIGQSKEAFVLGGGAEPNDGIFRYKTTFAPTGIVPFRVGFRIHDSEVYARLVAARATWESRLGRKWQPNDEYFPQYRG